MPLLVGGYPILVVKSPSSLSYNNVAIVIYDIEMISSCLLAKPHCWGPNSHHIIVVIHQSTRMFRKMFHIFLYISPFLAFSSQISSASPEKWPIGRRALLTCALPPPGSWSCSSPPIPDLGTGREIPDGGKPLSGWWLTYQVVVNILLMMMVNDDG